MADWMVWSAAAGVLIVLELFTGTFYLLMMALGLIFGALAAWLGAAMPLQTIAAAVVGIVATGLLHRSRWGRRPKADPARDQNVNLDIGQRLAVGAWQGRGTSSRVAGEKESLLLDCRLTEYTRALW